MKIGGVILGAGCAVLAALVSVHLFLDPDPEFLSLTSSDGSLTVFGTVYRAREVSLSEKMDDVAYAPLSLVRYTLSPSDIRFSEPLIATLPLAPSHVLYALHEHEGYATALDIQRDAAGNPYFLVYEGGEYAEGEPFSLEVPTFVDVVSNMRTRLPEHAVSYTLRVIATPHHGASILLPEAIEEGGCGGLPTQSEEHVRAEDERTVQVLVNDVLTETTFTFLMDIGTTSQGCPEDMPLQTIF